MNKAQYSDKAGKLATIPQAVEMYKIGRTKLMEIATQAGAIRRFGKKMIRIDIAKLDEEIKNH